MMSSCHNTCAMSAEQKAKALPWAIVLIVSKVIYLTSFAGLVLMMILWPDRFRSGLVLISWSIIFATQRIIEFVCARISAGITPEPARRWSSISLLIALGIAILAFWHGSSISY